VGFQPFLAHINGPVGPSRLIKGHSLARLQAKGQSQCNPEIGNSLQTRRSAATKSRTPPLPWRLPSGACSSAPTASGEPVRAAPTSSGLVQGSNPLADTTCKFKKHGVCLHA
jgi:hypothetical protein